jgi:D-glycero-D-manno-heptose 1,7-bisphosphate phosphatase
MSLVLLDRDGVINVDLPRGVNAPAELRMIDGSAEAIARFNQAGIKVAVCTNQSAIGKGWLTEEGLAEIHDLVRGHLAKAGAHVDAFYHCPDHPDVSSTHRKPAPGMLLDALRDFGAKAEETPFVGDAVTDLQAAKAIGCPFYLVETGKGLLSAADPQAQMLQPFKKVTNLAAMAEDWLRQMKNPA